MSGSVIVQKLSFSPAAAENSILALSEIYRTLIDGGLYYAIENEWNDAPAILELFDKIGRKPWSVFLEKQILAVILPR